MVYAVILAGGIGKRMNNRIPKQFILLNNKPIFIYVVEKVLENKNIDKIILCCHNSWKEKMNKMLKKYLDKEYIDIDIIDGGETRNDTIYNACKHIKKEYSIKDRDILITLESVRPFINQKIINDNIKMAKKYDAVNTIVPATDTICSINCENGEINDIPNRSTMYHGQAPQTFKLKELFEVLNSLTKEEKELYTEVCKAFLVRGRKVGVAEGSYENIKITTPVDLITAKAIIKEKNKHLNN